MIYRINRVSLKKESKSCIQYHHNTNSVIDGFYPLRDSIYCKGIHTSFRYAYLTKQGYRNCARRDYWMHLLLYTKNNKTLQNDVHSSCMTNDLVLLRGPWDCRSWWWTPCLQDVVAFPLSHLYVRPHVGLYWFKASILLETSFSWPDNFFFLLFIVRHVFASPFKLIVNI